MILDTNALSAWAENDPSLLRVLHHDRPWYLPSIVLGEYRYGLLASTERLRLESWLDLVEEACAVLAPDAITARHYSDLRRSTEAIGVRVPYHDIWIAALGLQYGLEIVSRDGHFDRMPGVSRVSW